MKSLEALVILAMPSLVISGGLLLAALLKYFDLEADPETKPDWLADHELADLANPVP
jgi:hypothetical protein